MQRKSRLPDIAQFKHVYSRSHVLKHFVRQSRIDSYRRRLRAITGRLCSVLQSVRCDSRPAASPVDFEVVVPVADRAAGAARLDAFLPPPVLYCAAHEAARSRLGGT